jgi:hypothetical protein
MLEQKLRRRSDFRAGTWVVMGDGQRWMFPHPPLPGTDRQYDALVQSLREAEDREDARSIELALGILLFSRNYDAQPRDYQAIFRFDANQAIQLAAQTAISALIYNDLKKRPAQSRGRGSPSPSFPVARRSLRTMCASYAARIRFPLARWVNSASPQQPTASRKLG